MKARLLPKLFAAIALAFLSTGCVVPRITAPRGSELLQAKADRDKLPIKSFKIESSDRQIETKHDLRMLAGTSRLVFYPKQAREFIEQDLRDYVNATFREDPLSDVLLTLRIEQAYTFLTMMDSGANLIPFVGVVTSVTDSFRDIPVTFITDVTVETRGGASTATSANVFVKNIETATSRWETQQTHDDRYRRQLQAVRTELFQRLDQQLLPLWQGQQFVGKPVAGSNGSAATLASELSRLDASLAEGKLTPDEHATMTKAVTERYRR
jgi:hypothetical protein